MRKLVPFLFVCACGPAPSDVILEEPSIDEAESEERWSQDQEAPELVVPDASVLLQDVITADDVGKTFGVDDDRVPYPDTYWPFVNGGIGALWDGTNSQSPLEKYMRMVAPGFLTEAYDWEQRKHGPLVPGVADWWGHCNGWTAAAMTNAPLRRPINARVGADGEVHTCELSEPGCVHYEIGDINALAAEVYLDADYVFLGSRCDVAPKAIERDRYGRVKNTGCKGVNPGSLMVILADRMKRQKLPMAIDAQTPKTTDQIWNQPAFRYTVNRYRVLSKRQAAQLVAGTSSVTSYKWNKDAKGFVFVDVSIHWVFEYGPNKEVVSGLSSQKKTRWTAVLELDAAPTSSEAKIIGGEYLEDDKAKTDRLLNAPFIWIANDTEVRFPEHNPYVEFATVKQLINLAR